MKANNLSNKKYKKVAMFTDIHFGRQNNSEIHNQDCLDYIDWFCENVKSDKDIDCVFFLGDWHEHRSSINGITLHYSFEGAKKLNDLGLPIYFIVGNHDLYYRNSRDVFTTVVFNGLNNFILVDEPIVLKQNKCVLAPYLFENEYEEFFNKYDDFEVFAGHFEFKGFVLTGEHNIKMDGPDPENYKKYKRIFSGHFHKRQKAGNICYIGNTFPADFSDANDLDRGMAIYNFEDDTLKFINWEDCPKYVKVKLSEIVKKPKKFASSKSRIKVLVDKDINIVESNEIKKYFFENYGIREMVLEEQLSFDVELSEEEKEINDMELESVESIIEELLKRIKSDKIDQDKLIKIYKSL